MNDHLKGLLITAFGVLLVVPDSLFVRLIDAEPLVTAFWRGLTSGVFILLFVLATSGFSGFRAVYRAGWPTIIYIFLMGSTTLGFVQAVTNTSVANVVFIFASIPIFATAFSRIFLGEPIQRRTVVTMLVVMCGLGIITYGSQSSEIASWKGDLWALYVSVAFAGALTAVRKVKNTSMIPAVPIAYIGAALVLIPLSSPLPALETQWPLIFGHGLFIATAAFFLTLGPRYISSVEVSLLILLESVLAPLLVWAVIGENPGRLALVGGAVVIGALLVSNLVAIRNAKATPA